MKQAADQKHPFAQYFLGALYYEGKHIRKNINKALHYLSLATEQNEPHALTQMGFIYMEGEYINQDINKAINYFIFASKNNNDKAQSTLGVMYQFGYKVDRDIEKAIEYYKMAAKKDNCFALHHLGDIYFKKQEINKAIYYYTCAADNNHTKSRFALAIIYHQGKHVERDLDKAIHYYKEASSMNDQYAKNNLSIIYKNKKNITYAIELLNEAINQNNDVLALFNLAHIYLYGEMVHVDIDKSIDLLLKSKSDDFQPADDLLCLALIKKLGSITFDKIKNEINLHQNKSDEFLNGVYNLIIENELEIYFGKFYQEYSNHDYLYDIDNNSILSSLFMDNSKETIKNTKINISDLFYEGFGIR